jgi:hypothetical protein
VHADINALKRRVVDLPAPGAFSHVEGAVRHAGASGGGAPASWAVEAPFGTPAGVPAFDVYRPEIVATPLANRALGETTVRTQPTYNMTRVMAIGGGTPGPHRWRLPV